MDEELPKPDGRKGTAAQVAAVAVMTGESCSKLSGTSAFRRSFDEGKALVSQV
jgi:hypothetical protein